VIFLAAPWCRALETDQFYAWNRPLKDATGAINAEVNAEIEAALQRIDARRKPCSCKDAEKAIHDRFEYAVIARIELWAMKSSLVDRVPANADEEPTYRREWIYGKTSPLDPINWMPASPTIEVAGVRIGADKLGHFFSDGEWAHQWYQRTLKHGATEDNAMAQAIEFSVVGERSIWGKGTSGTFSLSDLEADFQGLMFYRGLCGGAEPALEPASGGWRLKKPFDLRDWVGPAWDESWKPCIYSPSRWAKVRPMMRRYCERLEDPEVRNRRNAYTARDRETPMGAFVKALVASGKLPDPTTFTIEAVCAGGS